MSMFEIFKPSFQDRVHLFNHSLHLNPSGALGLPTNGIFQFLEAFLANVPSSPFKAIAKKLKALPSYIERP